MAIGNIYRRKGDWDQALIWLEKSRQLLIELGKLSMLAMCVSNMGVMFSGRGQYKLACLHHQEALEIYSRLKIALGVSHQHCHLGAVNRLLGNYLEARKHLDQALGQARALGELAYQPYILYESAKVAFGLKEYTLAQSYCEAGLQLLRNIGSQQHFFRRQATILGVNILQAKLAYGHGDAEQALHQLETMLQATQSQTEQAALYYARWQLDQKPESGRQALALYQKLYARRPYFQYQQRIDELAAGN
jgi:tetratricopeptide (TPR) repeat protein